MFNRYAILLEYDEDGPGFAVSVPALPGCFSQGATLPDAIERAKEAFVGHIATLVELGEDESENAPTLDGDC
jgi:predicted RNase H-like HicB family nuclease